MTGYFTNVWQALSHWVSGGNTTWVDLVISVGIVVAAIAIALLFSMLVFRLLIKATILGGADFDVKTIAAIRLPFAAFIVLSGIYVAITVLSPPPAIQFVVDKASGVVAVLIGAALVNGIMSATLLWLQVYLYRSNRPNEHRWMFPVVRRAMLAFVISITAMVCLDILGINITPLVAGLGIAGLAVALAVQPTLSNLFAGTYVITEGLISVGDYVEMSDGVNGYVQDVSWRSTRLRTWTNNLVVVPNSLFSETIITNFSKPAEPLDMVVSCGVAYESDLKRVEAVSREVMELLRRECPGADPDTEPIFRYEAFGDSNIEFYMILRARNRVAGFEVRSELIKELHWRLSAEGITINYPVRKLQLPDGGSPLQPVHVLPTAGDDSGT
jgi:small-conductance mechanosensitive channel